MKIIQDVQNSAALQNPAALPWWVGAKLRCDSCGTTVELEPEDTSRVSAIGSNTDGIQVVTAACPKCRQIMYRREGGPE